jgi:hypothetical protein
MAKGRWMGLSDIHTVHHYTNGNYHKTTITLTLEGGFREAFDFYGSKPFAEQVLRQLREWQAFIRRSFESKDIDAIRAFDPFFEARMEDSWSKPAPAIIDGPATKPLASIFRGQVMFGAAAISGVMIAGLLFSVHLIGTTLESSMMAPSPPQDMVQNRRVAPPPRAPERLDAGRAPPRASARRALTSAVDVSR